LNSTLHDFKLAVLISYELSTNYLVSKSKGRPARWKISKELMDSNNTTNQLDITDTQKPPTKTEYTFFSGHKDVYQDIPHIRSQTQSK
jgi:hypothetical protein